jgi:hypothetical protein
MRITIRLGAWVRKRITIRFEGGHQEVSDVPDWFSIRGSTLMKASSTTAVALYRTAQEALWQAWVTFAVDSGRQRAATGLSGDWENGEARKTIGT